MSPAKFKDKQTRTNIYVSAAAMANLKKLSKQNMGAPIAQLIRLAIDDYLRIHLKKH